MYYRSLKGSFPIVDRTGKVAGEFAEVEVHLEIAWRPPITTELNAGMFTYDFPKQLSGMVSIETITLVC